MQALSWSEYFGVHKNKWICYNSLFPADEISFAYESGQDKKAWNTTGGLNGLPGFSIEPAEDKKIMTEELQNYLHDHPGYKASFSAGTITPPECFWK